MRLSRVHHTPSSNEDAVPLRRLALWAVVGVAIIVGIILYFKYGRMIVPLATQ